MKLPKDIIWEVYDEFGNRIVLTKSCLRHHIYIGSHPWESTFVELTRKTVEKAEIITKDTTGIHYHSFLDSQIKQFYGFEAFNYYWVCAKMDKGGKYWYVATFTAVVKLQGHPQIIGGKHAKNKI